MKSFKSNDEFFLAVKKLASKLENEGKKSAANDLLNGLKTINGLTDGWALFMDALTQMLKQYSEQLAPTDIEELRDFHARVKKTVYRI